MELLQDCPRCQQALLPKLSYCKACGLPITEQALKKLRGEDASAGETAPEQISYLSAFKYPLRGSGMTLLIVGTVFFTVLNLLPGGGLFKLMISGYLAAYMLKIINETARGNLEPAEWPDFTNLFDDIIMPLFQVVVSNLFCFLPCLLVLWSGVGLGGIFAILAGEGTPEGFGMMGLALLLLALGLAYLPVALLSVALNGSVLGLHPGIGIRLLSLLKGEYAIVLGVLVLSVAANQLFAMLFGAMPLLGGLLAGGFGLYSMMVNMHVIGLIYYKNRARFSA